MLATLELRLPTRNTPDCNWLSRNIPPPPDQEVADGMFVATRVPQCPHVVKSAAVCLCVFSFSHVCRQSEFKTVHIRRSHRPGRAAVAALDVHKAVCFQQGRHRQIGQTVRWWVRLWIKNPLPNSFLPYVL